MDLKQILAMSFDGIKERKIKSILTILMVMVGSSLMVAVSGIGFGFSEFFNKQTSNLAGNIMFINSAPQPQSGNGAGPAGGGAGGGGGGPPPTAKITLNAAIENRLGSLPFVKETIPSYQTTVSLESQGKAKDYSVFSINPEKLTILAPTLEYVDGSVVRQNDPSAIIISSDVSTTRRTDTVFVIRANG